MPVEFLNDDEAAAYAAFATTFTRKQLDTGFFLDNEDLTLIGRRRGDHMRLGFALQLVTVRQLGTFLPDPIDVPTPVLDYVAEQLGVEDPSCVKRYLERRPTRFEHAEEIRRELALVDFADAEAELAGWIDARSWTTGDGPKAIFLDAVTWLRKRRALLPGLTTLARLVARVRDETTRRLYDTLAAVPSTEQRRLLEALIEVRAGARLSDLERWRRAPTKTSGPEMVKALERVAAMSGLGLGAVDLVALVPRRRVVELARYGMAASAPQLRRHPPARKTATLLAAVVHLEAKAIDDALELFDLLMVSELVGKAQREAERQRLRHHPRLAQASGKLAAVVQVLLDLPADTSVSVDELWRAIEAVLPRAELRAALATINELAPPGDDDDADWRANLAGRIVTVSGFLKTLTEVIEFGANADGEAALAAMRDLPALLRSRRKLTPDDLHQDLVTGSWRRLVLPPGGGVDRGAYVFCVLTEFHRRLRRRDVFAEGSTRFRDPRAQLLTGEAWVAAKPAVLTALGLPEEPDSLLADLAALLDEAYREVAHRLGGNAQVSLDKDNKLHVAALKAVAEPASLTALDKRLEAMLPRVDLPEVILEVMGWEPGFLEAFTALSGGRARLGDLGVSIAACLTAHAMNVGFMPMVNEDVPALERDRLYHVDHTYLKSPENYAGANAHLVTRQAAVPLALAMGGGHVAGVDGMRFVVAVPSIFARPNPKYFGRGRGITWLNMLNDQGAGLGYKIVAGAPKDTLHVLDVAFNQDGGRRPDVLITDAGSYADVIFGLVHLMDMAYRPALDDLPDQRLWRTDAHADYGPLNAAARGRIDLGKIRTHWPDILRVVGSIYSGAIRAVDVMRMLQRDNHPTPLGEAIAAFGRIHKSLHLLAFIDDESYRRAIKGMRNLQEGRHSVAATIFHGRRGKIYKHYHEGMEDQLGALGLVLNCVVVWNTAYMNAALDRLRASGYPVLEDDVARLSPFKYRHLNVHGHYLFRLPEMPAGLRPLRDPDAPADEDEDQE